VRFGSTETTLQISGIPLSLSREETLLAFQAGWGHKWGGENCQGFYIGREHTGYTEVRIVKSVSVQQGEGKGEGEGEGEGLIDCEEGQPGYIITRGGHVMKGYVNQPQQTKEAISPDGWYLKLGDMGFYLGPKRDLYWQSRDTQMLIRGGSNYAFEQVNDELSQFIEGYYSLPRNSFIVAVCGLRVKSEHEDECCVMIQLLTEEAQQLKSEIESTFLTAAKGSVSKGSKPDRMAVGEVPMVLSKGIVSVPQLVLYWKQQ
jgi:acyl-CoA synthetase (AMP-forming)/AMP-acid ligase II